VKCYSSLVVSGFLEINLIHAPYFNIYCYFTYFYVVLRLRGLSSLSCFYIICVLFGFVDFIVILNLIMLIIYVVYFLLNWFNEIFYLSLVCAPSG
jgi:hypothetical protein